MDQVYKFLKISKDVVDFLWIFSCHLDVELTKNCSSQNNDKIDIVTESKF